MKFNKSQLAMAIAISMSTTAAMAVPATNNSGTITFDGTASVGSANASTDTRMFKNVISPVNEVFEKAQSGPSAVYQSNNESLLTVSKADLYLLSMDLQDIDPNGEEFLTTGSESTFVFDDVTSRATIIKTNGAHIEHNGSAAAIEISHSELTGVDFDEPEKGDDPIDSIWEGSKELLTNNGGEIVAMGLGNAIDIKNSTLNGLIVNEDWGNEAENTMKGGFVVATKGAGISLTDSTLKGGIQNVSRQDAAKIIGGRAAIELNNSTLNGYIVNEQSGGATDDTSKPVILGNDVAIAINGGKVNGGIKNSGIIVAEGVTWYDETTGNNSDKQFDTLIGSKLNGTTSFEANGRAGILLKDGASFNGNIDNSGRIAGLYGIKSFTTNGKPNSYIGDINNTGIIDGGMTGISLERTNFKGTISNSGTITGSNGNGIFIDDSVTGKVVINQIAGELNGATALRMNNATRTNYTGGKITGNVDNHGGTFYVEGDQSIAGDYMQTAGSTLAMGLHKQTSLTANNINLAEGSKVLIDLRQGNLYVQNGQKVELLKVNADGKITDAKVDYVVNSNLVKVANVDHSVDGKITLTFDRTSFTQSSDELIKSGKISGQQANNVTRMAAVLNKLDDLAKSNPAVAQLLNNLNGSPESFTSLLPDVSGASVAGAMSAVSQSGSLVSVRATSLASGDMLDNSGMWMQGLVSKGDQDNRNGEAYDVKSRGFVLGADTKLDTGLVVGAAYSFINTDSTTQNSNTDSDYHMATAYASQAIDQILLDGQAYYAWGDNDSNRNIGTTANYDSSLYGARVGAGYQFDVAPATRLIPTLSLEASRLSIDGYTEAGSAAALKMDSQRFNRTELGLNTELSKDYQMRNAMLTPSVNLGVFHDFEGEAQNSTVAFAATPAESFNVTGTKPEKTRYVTGLGLDIMSNANFTVSAEYNYNWNADGFDANSGAMKFRWDF